MKSDDRPLEPLDISVLGADSHVWLSAHSSAGSVHGVPRKLPRWPDDGWFPTGEAADWLTEAVRLADRDSLTQAREVGRVLTDLVFGLPDVAGLLQLTRGRAGHVGGQVLLRLLAAPGPIAAWPWELMVDPQDPSRFLTLTRDVHVVRAARSRTYPARQAPLTPPLNLLLVMSSPLATHAGDEETVFDLYAEKRALLAELQPLVNSGLLDVEVETRPTMERLRKRVAARRRGFHIVHYLGHARPDGLRLERPDGTARLVEARDFTALLQQLPDLRLVMFAGCETAKAPLPTPEQEGWPGPLSLADLCVRDASPMVVGMQVVLPFTTERVFTRLFYQALTAGHPVVEALRLARLAVASDEQTGGGLVNWAVPTLFVGGVLPEPLVDPEARAKPRPAPRQVVIREGVDEGELRFISRLPQLRTAVDVLSGVHPSRMVCVVGGRQVGKTLLLDRAIEELDPDTGRILLTATQLMAVEDSLGRLCDLVAEVADRLGVPVTAREDRTSARWWERLLGDLASTRLAVGIDDLDLLDTDVPKSRELLSALSLVPRRRSRIRLAVAACAIPTLLSENLDTSRVEILDLKPLQWADVWQWIRRNVPILGRYQESELSGLWSRLPRLEDWERLAGQLSGGGSALASSSLPQLATMISGSASAQQPAPVYGVSERSGLESLVIQPKQRDMLRIAVAGPFTEGRADEFARALTSFAAEHRVAGRVTMGSTDTASALARLVDVASPFREGTADESALVTWLEEAVAEGADVLVLDFGGPEPLPRLRDRLNQLVGQDRLVLAAANMDTDVGWPAREETVLAVGAADAQGKPMPWSPFDRALGKPDLYAPASLAATQLAAALTVPALQGTAAAAIYAGAAATLVWASDLSQRAGTVRSTLLDSASTRSDLAGPPVLDLQAALASVRTRLVLGRLSQRPISLGQVAAETGLPSDVVGPVLWDLTGRFIVTAVSENGVERFQYFPTNG